MKSVEDSNVDWKRNGPALVYLRLKGERFLDSPGIAKKSLEADPSNAVNLNNYGIAQLYSGDPEGAKRSFLKAHELDPKLPGRALQPGDRRSLLFLRAQTRARMVPPVPHALARGSGRSGRRVRLRRSGRTESGAMSLLRGALVLSGDRCRGCASLRRAREDSRESQGARDHDDRRADPLSESAVHFGGGSSAAIRKLCIAPICAAALELATSAPASEDDLCVGDGDVTPSAAPPAFLQ